MPLKIVCLRPQKLVSTKTQLLKHYYRRQGIIIGNWGWERLFTILCNLFGLLFGGTLVSILSATLIDLREMNQEHSTWFAHMSQAWQLGVRCGTWWLCTCTGLADAYDSERARVRHIVLWVEHIFLISPSDVMEDIIQHQRKGSNNNSKRHLM